MLLIPALTALAEDRALLIDTSVQPAGSSWHGADLSDALPLVRRALDARGITRIDTLSGTDATLDAIRARLDALAAEAGAGDLVFVYYTGHGAQAEDDDRDEPDGLDELLVPYGATDAIGSYLRDDELGRKLDAVAAKVGAAGQVVVVLDACHSGTGTRGAGGADALGGRALGGAQATGIETGSGWLGAPTNQVVLSAARHDQTAQWRKDAAGAAGVFTRALVGMLLDAESDLSYRALEVQLAEAMGRDGFDQVPVVEGAVDNIVLGGRGAQAPFFRVSGASGREATVDGGLLSGLTVGSTVAVAPAGSRDASGAITRGTVVHAEANVARVALESEVAPGALWALVEAWGPPPALPVAIDASAERLRDGFLGALAGRVTLTEGAPWTLRVEKKAVRLDHVDGTAIEGPPAKAPDWTTLAARVEELLRADALRSLRLDDPDHRLSLRTLPLLPAEDGACRVDTLGASTRDDADPSWSVGQGVAFELYYRGTAPAFVTLVVFPPEGGAVRLLPADGAPAESAKVDDYTAFTVGARECLAFDAPGTYVVKGYATTEPLRVEWLDAGTSRGAGAPASLVGHTASVVLQVR
jgi:hypothetical protein